MYKLIKEYPNRNIGDTIYMRLNGGEETYYWSKDNELLSKDFFPESKWFAPMLFTTEDKVDIYLGDTYWIQLTNKCIVEVPTRVYNTEGKGTYSSKKSAEECLKPLFISEDGVEIHTGDEIWVVDKKNIICSWLANINSNYIFSDDKIFSSKEAAEKYLEPKFKIGDYFVYDNEVHKIDNIKISSFISNEKSYDKALCRKADNSEIISYYEKLGWIKGAKCCEVSWNTYIIENLEVIDSKVFVNYTLNPEVKVKDCKSIDVLKLIKEPNYPKSWEDLESVEGWFFDFYSRKFHNNSTAPISVNKNLFKTEKQAESALAYAQLSQLVAEMNGDWQPNWNDCMQDKYTIERENNFLMRSTRTQRFVPLAFKTEEARDFSFKHHKELWNKYYQL